MIEKLPRAISNQTVTQQLKHELLVYNLETNLACCLNETAARVYLACDGKTTLGELIKQTRFTEDLIYLTLDNLKEKNLIETNILYRSVLNDMSRREALKRVGLATTCALPLINSIAAPQAAQAQSATTSANGVCRQDPVPDGCINALTFALGQASTNADCRRQINALPACCSGTKSAVYSATTGCCLINCLSNPYA